MAFTKKQKQMIRTWLESKYSDEPHPKAPLLMEIDDEASTVYEKVADVRDSETFHQDFEDEIEAWRAEQFDEIKTKIRSGDKYPIHTTVGQKRVGFKRLI